MEIAVSIAVVVVFVFFVYLAPDITQFKKRVEEERMRRDQMQNRVSATKP